MGVAGNAPTAVAVIAKWGQTSRQNGQTRRSAPTHVDVATDHRGNRQRCAVYGRISWRMEMTVGNHTNVAVRCVGADLRVCPLCNNVRPYATTFALHNVTPHNAPTVAQYAPPNPPLSEP